MTNAHDPSTGQPVTVTLNAILQWVMGIASVLITGAVIWVSTQIVDMDRRLSIIEANRYTATDAIGLEERLNASYVTYREYTAAYQNLNNQLAEIRALLEERR